MAAADGHRGPRLRPRRRARPLRELEAVELIEAAERDRTTTTSRCARSARRPDASIVRAAADVAAGSLRRPRQPGLDRRDDDRRAVRAEADPLRAAPGAGRPAPGAGPRAAGAAARRRRQLRRPRRPTSSSSPTSAPRSPRRSSGWSEPRVALLSIGEEAKKGNALVVEAHAALAEMTSAASSAIDFRGNVEGRDLLDRPRRRGRHRRLHRQRRPEDGRGHRERGRRSGRRSRPLGPASRRRGACSCDRRSAACAIGWTPTRTGGAILLGLRGVAVVGHGSSGPRGHRQPDRLAARAVRERAVERTAELLERSGAGRDELSAASLRSAAES